MNVDFVGVNCEGFGGGVLFIDVYVWSYLMSMDSMFRVGVDASRVDDVDCGVCEMYVSVLIVNDVDCEVNLNGVMV